MKTFPRPDYTGRLDPPLEGRRKMGLSDRASFLQTQAAVPLGLRLTGLSWAKVGTGLGVLFVVKSQWEW